MKPACAIMGAPAYHVGARRGDPDNGKILGRLRPAVALVRNAATGQAHRLTGCRDRTLLRLGHASAPR